MNDQTTARLGTAKALGFGADITIDGQEASHSEAVAALAIAFPHITIASSDIEDDGLGCWLVPVTNEVAALVLDGDDFEWTDGRVTVFIPAP
jgi:hypothetical protein